MHLIQVLLPLSGAGDAHTERFGQVREELTSRFGGLTFYRNSPAEGLWHDGDSVERDAIVIAEVMVDEIDQAWWAGYRRELERRFGQDEIVIRALAITRL